MADVERSNDERLTRAHVLLLVLFGSYCFAWIVVNGTGLLDPLEQRGDASTHLVNFIQYDSNPLLADDPVLSEMRPFTTPGFFLIYRALVPIVGLLTAAKVVQGLCYLIPVTMILVVARAKPDRLAAIVLVVFVFLHTEELASRVAGGLQRSFAIPWLIVWIAGALLDRRSIRMSGIFLAALTYPVASAQLVASETVFVLLRTFGEKEPLAVRRLIQHGALLLGTGLLAGAIVVPWMIGARESAGPLQTARDNPEVMGQSGRIKALPFDAPLKVLVNAAMAPLSSRVEYPPRNRRHRNFILALLGAGLLAVWGIATGRLPVPTVSLSLGIAGTGLFLLARYLAFQLYLPDRYLTYGVTMAVVVAIGEIVPEVVTRLPGGKVASALAVTTLFLLNDPSPAAKTSNRRYSDRQAIWHYLDTTAMDSRIACHPLDCDGVTLWTSRASTEGFETLQPWFRDSWQRQESSARQTLEALYATDSRVIADYCRSRRVTHFLLEKVKYGPEFVNRSRVFEPLDSHTRELLAGLDADDLVMGNYLRDSAVFEDDDWAIVECDAFTRRLRTPR